MRLLIITMFLLTAAYTVKAQSVPVKHVAMIFDDGPTTDNAPKFLAIFEQENIHVTFGYIGTNVETHPDVAKTVVAAGHEIANHSYSHLHPKDLHDTSLEFEVVNAQQVIVDRVGYSPKWYWLPYIESDPRIPAIAEKVNLKVYALKSFVSSDDYNRNFTAEQIRQKATSNIVDGTTLLFHEWRNETVAEMPAIIAELKQQGCVFMTFSELAEYLESQNTATKTP